MTSYVLKKLIAAVLCLAVGIVAYNYFWGTEEEQKNSRQIIGQVKVLTNSVSTLLSSEKAKYDEGKYDEAISKLKTAFETLKEKANAMGETGKDVLDQVDALQQRERELEEELAALRMEGEVPDKGERMMKASPGSEGADSTTDSPQEDRARRAEQIRQELLKLNEDAERITAEFS